MKFPSVHPDLSISCFKNIRLVVAIVLAISLREARPFILSEHMTGQTLYTPQQNPDNYTAPPDGCSPVQINLVARHGTRFPPTPMIEEFIELESLLANIVEYLENPQFDWLTNWSNPYDLAYDAGILHEVGIEEQYEMGQRMLQNMPQLFPPQKPYYPTTHVFESTQVSRAAQSAAAFSSSVIDSILPNGIPMPFYHKTESPDIDTTLLFSRACSSYSQWQTENSREIDMEAQLWKDLKFPDIGSRISQLLGVSAVYNFTDSSVETIYRMCQYEIALSDTTDRFCAVFEEQDILDIEYYDDLDNYYNNGYGFEFNTQIAGHLLALLFRSMEEMQDYLDDVASDVEIDELPQIATLRFGHFSSIIYTYVILGLFKDDEHLRHDSSPELIDNRKWKTSQMAPFSGNLQIILYECEDDELKVKLLVNEKETQIPGEYCGGEIYCSYDDFKQTYQSQLDMDFDAVCFGEQEERGDVGDVDSVSASDDESARECEESSCCEEAEECLEKMSVLKWVIDQ